MASYIINNGSIVAKLKDVRESGEQVRFSSQVCDEAINANRTVNLVNASTGKISNAAKWDRVYSQIEDPCVAREVNPGEFQIL